MKKNENEQKKKRLQITTKIKNRKGKRISRIRKRIQMFVYVYQIGCILRTMVTIHWHKKASIAKEYLSAS